MLRVLDEAQTVAPATGLGHGPARDWLARASYVEAVCWTGACLASALHHAHERGLLHLDLKPSNVLLAADGTPMLLDFHLARPPLAAGATAPPWLGGTPAYLSPEQAAAMAAVRQGRPISAAVDGRSDVFSLGLVLYEALAGALPRCRVRQNAETGALPRSRVRQNAETTNYRPPTATPQSLRLHNARVSVGLADLVARCLEPRASDRYPNAAALADDLRRHLADQPLRGVLNRDPRERWRKWRRRRPFALAVLGMLLVAVTAAALVAAHVVRQFHKAQTALEEGRANLHQQRYADASASLRRGLVLAEDLPASGGLAEELAGALRLAQRGEAACNLHLAAERIRGVYGAGSLPPNELRAVEQSCRDLWEQRRRITEVLGAGLPSEVEQQVKNDLLELALLAATLRVARARPDEASGARGEALAMLGEIERMLGPSPVLFHERWLLAEAQGLKDLAHEAHSRLSQAPARTAWEHYAVGCSWLRRGKLEQAATELEQAVELAPQDLWANFAKGKCAYQRGRPEEALVSFAACVALAPDSASCFYNRGLAYEARGDAEALRDYDRALSLDPGLAAASLSRGLLHARAGRADKAAVDLQAALSGGAEPASTHYGLALVYLARRDRAAVRLSLDRALRHDPTHKQARELRDSLRPLR